MNATARILRVFYSGVFPIVSPYCSQLPHMTTSKWCPYPGLLVEVINLVAREAGLTIVPITRADLSYNLTGNFVHDQLDVLMADPHLDLVATSMQVTEERAEKYSFSEPLYQVATRALKRMKSGKYEHMWSFFETYGLSTWAGMAGAWLIQLLFCVLVRQAEAKLSGMRPLPVSESAWQVFRVGMMQPEKVHFRLSSGKVAFFFFSLLQGTVLLKIFSSIILASMIRWHEEPDSMREILHHLEKRDYYLVTHNPQWMAELMNVSRAFWFSGRLISALDSNPIRWVETNTEALELVETDTALYLHLVDDSVYYESLSHCGLEVLDEEMPALDAHFMLRKNHPLLPLLNRAIRANREALRRILEKYIRYMDTLDKCADPDYVEEEVKRPLGLSPFGGVLIVCLCIMSVALVCLLLEISCGRIKRVRRRVHAFRLDLERR
ncbi:hypothetical protein M3Y99_01083100 [Aphelenchoides fujianensis]|nr:hypothetical protein M3Y99_01083100 [Aphelenchoides fujianensis]